MQTPSKTSLSCNKGEELESQPLPGKTVQCTTCRRFFNEFRISKHQKACQMLMRKRNTFDASRHRVKGTEAEKFYKPVPPRSATGASTSMASKRNCNWRKQHEEFIAAIRAARELKAFLAKGGKLSELPPSTPTECTEYIECPYCYRSFNETAANRHIPKCATMAHNKPKQLNRK